MFQLPDERCYLEQVLQFESLVRHATDLLLFRVVMTSHWFVEKLEGAVDWQEESGIVNAGKGLVEVPWNSSDGMLPNAC